MTTHGFIKRTARAAGLSAALLLILGTAAAWAAEILSSPTKTISPTTSSTPVAPATTVAPKVSSASPNPLVVVPGGGGVVLTLTGANLDQISKCVVVRNMRVVSGITAEMEPPVSTNRKMIVRAAEGTTPGNAQLRLFAGAVFVDVPSTVAVIAITQAKATTEKTTQTALPSTPVAGGTGEQSMLLEAQKQANADLEMLAKDIANLCNHPGFLGFLRSEIVHSKYRENIIELDSFLERATRQQGMPANVDIVANKERAAKSRHKGLNLSSLEGFDLYIPVEAHRAKWRGGKDFIIAVSPYGDDLALQETVGYSVSDGQKVVISAKQPPDTVVLVIAPEEHLNHTIPVNEPMDEPKKSPHENSPKVDAGITEKSNSYFSMSYIKLHTDGESWLRGNPEIYLLAGQICNGEGKGYYYDLQRVDDTGKWYYIYDLNKMYFDTNCSWDTYYTVWESDGWGGGVAGYRNCQHPTPHIRCYPDSSCDYQYVYTLWVGNDDDPILTYEPFAHTNKMLGIWQVHNYENNYSDTRYAEAKFYKQH